MLYGWYLASPGPNLWDRALLRREAFILTMLYAAPCVVQGGSLPKMAQDEHCGRGSAPAAGQAGGGSWEPKSSVQLLSGKGF